MPRRVEPTRSWLFVAGDAGGGAALEPVIRSIESTSGGSPGLFAYGPSLAQWEKTGRRVESIEAGFSVESAVRLLQQRKPAIVVCGTSVNEYGHELTFIQAARALGIPSLAVLDFWSNYSERFRLPGGDRSGASASLDAMILPDAVAVPDARAAQEMAAKGICREMIHATGHPGFDSLQARHPSAERRLRQSARRRLALVRGEKLVAFVSQPISAMAQMTGTPPPFDEREVMRAVFSTLGSIRPGLSPSLRCLVLPHPREDRSQVEGFLSEFPGVSIASLGREELVAAADLVIGMNSILLMEAAWLGKPVLSVQPAMQGRDLLPSNQWGATLPVYTMDALKPAMESLLFRAKDRTVLTQRALATRPLAGAAGRVLALAAKLASGHHEQINTDRNSDV